MQTKQQIQQLLESAGVNPNKRRGQNFLIDLNLMRVLVEAASIRSNDTVLEIGPGTGSLTEELVKTAADVIAVEIDDILAKILKKQIADAENLQLFVTDALQNKNTIDRSVTDALIETLDRNSGRLLLVSNLPYSIACPAMLNLITGPVTADAMYVTVQKEVAQRMTAEADSDHYGPLSIMMAATGDLSIIKTLKPSVFWPAPQIDSAIVSFVRNEEKISHIQDMSILSELVGLLMQHRRKMVRACVKFAEGRLAGIHNFASVFEDCCIDPHRRPEEITPESYIAMANICFQRLNRG